MPVQVFVGMSVLYILVVVGGGVAWRWDREQRAKAANVALVVADRKATQLKIQLNEEREGRRALEGYYILEDSANLDHEWRASMAFADNELEANDPKGSTS
jgi:hypothetical protein